MTKRVIFLVVAALFVLTVCTSVTFAAPFYSGRPVQFHPGDSSGYFIWNDERGWHVITTSDRRVRQFSGAIRTDGQIQQVKAIGLERNDRLKPDYRRDKIEFNFKSDGREDGIVFNIIGERFLRFDLFVDGKRIDPRYVFIGRQGWRPSQSPFQIDIH